MNGPTTKYVPGHTTTVCTGCDHLNVQPGMRSRFEHKDTYSCTHPDNKEFSSAIFGRGRTIAYMSSIAPECPSWCPLKSNSNGNIQ